MRFSVAVLSLVTWVSSVHAEFEHPMGVPVYNPVDGLSGEFQKDVRLAAPKQRLNINDVAPGEAKSGPVWHQSIREKAIITVHNWNEAKDYGSSLAIEVMHAVHVRNPTIPPEKLVDWGNSVREYVETKLGPRRDEIRQMDNRTRLKLFTSTLDQFLSPSFQRGSEDLLEGARLDIRANLERRGEFLFKTVIGDPATQHRVSPDRMYFHILDAYNDPAWAEALNTYLKDLNNNASVTGSVVDFRNANLKGRQYYLSEENAKQASEIQTTANKTYNEIKKLTSPQNHGPQISQKVRAELNAAEFAAEEKSLTASIQKMELMAGSDEKLQAAAKQYGAAMKKVHEASRAPGGSKSPEFIVAKQKMKIAEIEYNTAHTESEIAQLESKNQIDRIQMGMQAIGVLAGIIGKSDPEAARVMSITTNFIGGVAMGLLMVPPNPMAILSAFGSLIGALFGGESDTQMILNAIRDLRKDLENLRKEMHERFDILERKLDMNFNKLFSVLDEEFRRIENQLDSEFHNVRDMHRQSHGGLERIQEQLVHLEKLRAEDKLEATYKDAHRAFDNIFNDDLKKLSSVDSRDIREAFLEIKRCAADYSTKGIAIPKAKDRSEFLKAIGRDYLELEDTTASGRVSNLKVASSIEYLPLLNEAFNRVYGHPLWDASGKSTRDQKLHHLGLRQIPNAALWAYCADKYIKFFESNDTKYLATLVRNEKDRVSSKDNIPLNEMVLAPGKVAQEAISTLLKDPRYIKSLYAHLHGQVEAMEAKLAKQYHDEKTAQSAGNAGAVLHAGPFQKPWARPTFENANRQYHLELCTPEPATPLPKSEWNMTPEEQWKVSHGSGLDQTGAPTLRLPDRDVLVNATPIAFRNAEALGLGKVRFCLSSIEFVHDESSYLAKKGDSMDWFQHRHGHLKMKFELQFIPNDGTPTQLLRTFDYDERKKYPATKLTHYETIESYHNMVELIPKVKEFFKKHDHHKALDNLNFQLAFVKDSKHHAESLLHVLKEENIDAVAMLKEIIGVEKAFSTVPVSSWTMRGRPGVTFLLMKNRTTPATYLARDNMKAYENAIKAIEEDFAAYQDPIETMVEKGRKLDHRKQVVTDLFADILRDEWFRFYQELALEENDGTVIDGSALNQQVEQRYRRLRGRLKRHLEFEMVSELLADRSSTEAFIESLLKTSDAIYYLELKPKYQNYYRGNVLAVFRQKAQEWNKKGIFKRRALELQKGAFTQQQKAVIDSNLSRLDAMFTNVFVEAQKQENIPASDKSLVDASFVQDKLEPHYERGKKVFLDSIRAQLPKSNETQESNEVFLSGVNKIVDDIYLEVVRPTYKTNTVGFVVERELRKRTVEKEKAIRDSLWDENDNAEGSFNQRFAEIQGTIATIKLAEQVATFRPESHLQISNFVGGEFYKGMKNPSEAIPKEKLPESAQLINELMGRKELSTYSKLFGLPMYATNGKSVFDLWKQNIKQEEEKTLKRFEETLKRQPTNPLLDSILRRGAALK